MSLALLKYSLMVAGNLLWWLLLSLVFAFLRQERRGG